MSFILYAWVGLQLLIGYNLVLPLVLLVRARVKKHPERLYTIRETEADYAVIVTAYEQTQHLEKVVESILSMHYSNYLIYVVADNCDVGSLRFSDNRVVLLRPPAMLGSNTRSHFYAIEHFRRPHERLTIVDCDNLVAPDLLSQFNRFFDRGFEAVQGTRAPKNLDTTVACLDAARDVYYHYYDGQVLFQNGSSATLAGSGMAFTVRLYCECLATLDVQGAGFDKVLQYQIVRRKHRIAFNPEAIVYDEKTSHSDQLVKQRARWINTWFRYCGYGLILCKEGLKNSNRNQLLFGIVLLRPPLFIFILLSLGCLFANLWILPVASMAWLGGLVVFMASFLLALKHSPVDRKVYHSLASIPRFIGLQVISLTKARKANKISIATTHYHHQEKTAS